MRALLLFEILLLLCFSSCKDKEADFLLPPQVAYCGPLEDYFLGSAVSGAMGTPTGIWNALIGPNYTSPNFLSSEVISINIDGQSRNILPEMHRGRKSGIFYGAIEIEGMVVSLVDFTNDKMPWVTRYLSVKNSSGKPHLVSICATVVPEKVEKTIVNNSALSLRADTTKWNFDKVNLESKNWADRFSLIAFNVPSAASLNGDTCLIRTEEVVMNNGKEYRTALYHFQHFQEEGKEGRDYLQIIRNRDIAADLNQSISGWKAWFDIGNMHEDHMKLQKAKDVVEGSLVMVKMLQDTSGGFIAGLREYPHSYVRDTHGACRLLGITGHNEEVKKAIETISYKTKVFGHIPNAWQMGANKFHYYKFNNPASETPAYFVLMMRDYLGNTKDQKFLEQLYPDMKNAIDVQIKEMRANNWKIDFNGDETERYTVRKDGEMYGKLTDWAEDKDLKNWSFPSATLALVSTTFLVDYLNATGRTDLANEYSAVARQIKNAIDSTFWRSDLNIHDWCRKRDNSWPQFRLPNYDLLPVWTGAVLNNDRQDQDALAMRQYINPVNGYLPTAPGDVEGFSGHNLAYLLYAMKKLDDPLADSIHHTLMTAPIISCWGTVSEFYGPNAVPNGHLLNPFSSGILGEALIKYAIGFK
jgi:hypothetical protein